VASRAEEKQRRRAERVAQEQKALAAAQRARRLQIIGGGVLVVVLVAVAVIVAIGGGSKNSSSNAPASAGTGGAPIPKPGPLAVAAKLPQAAAAAGCVSKTFPSEGRTHTLGKVHYRTNPPTSGDHNPTPAEDGIYDPGNTPAKENFVHTLEHGRIEVQYRPGTPTHTIDQLKTLFNEPLNGTPGYHMLLFQNNTNMPYAVAATAWTHLLGCPSMNSKVFDAIRAFRAAYTDKAPEQIP
jgi:hypothetical protein